MPKCPQFIRDLKQPPKGPHHGRNRRTSPTTYSDPNSQSYSGFDTGKDDATAFYYTSQITRAQTDTRVDTDAIRQAMMAYIDKVMSIPMWNSSTFSFGATEEAKPKTVPYAGIAVGEIIAHRYWKVIDGSLWSAVANQPWPTNKPMTGNINEHVATYNRPVFGGVHAYKNSDMCEMRVRIITNHFGTWNRYEHFVIGTVELWGEVIECEDGYRAEYAKVHSLDWASDGIDLEALKARYGV